MFSWIFEVASTAVVVPGELRHLLFQPPLEGLAGVAHARRLPHISTPPSFETDNVPFADPKTIVWHPSIISDAELPHFRDLGSIRIPQNSLDDVKPSV